MKDILFTLNAWEFYLLTLAGMTAHAVKKWFSGEIEGHVLRWYLDNKKYTVGVLFAAFGATAASLGGGVFKDINDTAQFMACFAVAFGIDSFNKQ